MGAEEEAARMVVDGIKDSVMGWWKESGVQRKRAIMAVCLVAAVANVLLGILQSGNVDHLMVYGRVGSNDFDGWLATFNEHAESNVVKGIELPMSRKQFCDESKTEVFRSVKDPKKIVIHMHKVNVPNLGFTMANPNFVDLLSGYKVETNQMKVGLSPAMATSSTPDMGAVIDVEDFNKWNDGFSAHATSKLVSGLELPVSRSEFCDESKTEVYRSVKNPNRVFVNLAGVDLETLEGVMSDVSFQELTNVLGEKAKTMSVV